MKYYIIAGEASGDLHGSNLMNALKKQDTEAEFRFWGGELMQAHGGELIKHYKNLAFMGFYEVFKNLPTILRNISFCKKDIKKYRPDCVILIDYPGFNLRIAKYCKLIGIKVFYYISPQVWAWKAGRVKQIKQNVDKMLVILPFEEAFYKKFDYKVSFIGHPLLDAINNFPKLDEVAFHTKYKLENKPIIALLPGSRKQEISVMLNIMLSVVNTFKEYQFVVAGAPSIPIEAYKKIVKGRAKIISNDTYSILQTAKAALVTSGTATLETALFKVPEIVCYKGNRISYEIAKRVVKNISFISLVNLIMNKELVKELIQNELNTENLKKQLGLLLEENNKQKIQEGYIELENKLGGIGASERAAKEIIIALEA
ncbi:MAG: lipid-A-disaccharide synthase [Solirubrobacteraceae bacterium]